MKNEIKTSTSATVSKSATSAVRTAPPPSAKVVQQQIRTALRAGICRHYCM